MRARIRPKNDAVPNGGGVKGREAIDVQSGRSEGADAESPRTTDRRQSK